jgi:hypothetical protein
MTGASWIAEKLTQPSGKQKARPIDDDIIFLERVDMPDEFVGVVPIEKGTHAYVTSDIVEPLVERNNKLAFVVSIPKVARWSGRTMAWLGSRNIAFGGVGDLYSASANENMRAHRNKERAFVEDGLRLHTQVRSVDWDEDRLIRVQLKSGLAVSVALCNEYDITMAVARDFAQTYGKFDVLLKTNPNGSITSNGRQEIEALGFKTLKWGELLGELAKHSGSGRSSDLRKRLEPSLRR